MAWNIEAADEFQQWFGVLSSSERVAVAAKVNMLEELGPTLGRPHVDTLKGSRYTNMKELRVQHAGKPYRVLFAFDPRQTAILLIGGVKGKKKWYEKTIALADRIYTSYLDEIKKEGLT
jgi:hypothetical protein